MQIKFNIVHMCAESDDVLVFGLTRFACSACAPRHAKPDEIASEITKRLGVVVHIEDVAKHRPGPSSPTPCNHDGHRQHWFLVYQQELPRRANRKAW